MCSLHNLQRLVWHLFRYLQSSGCGLRGSHSSGVTCGQVEWFSSWCPHRVHVWFLYRVYEVIGQSHGSLLFITLVIMSPHQFPLLHLPSNYSTMLIPSMFSVGWERNGLLRQHPIALIFIMLSLSPLGEIITEEVSWHRAMPPCGKSDIGKVTLAKWNCYYPHHCWFSDVFGCSRVLRPLCCIPGLL